MAEIKALVPVMTSNTEPSGVVEYSSVWTSSGNYEGYHAFDDNNSTYWAASSQLPNEWISYEFPERKRVTQIFIDSGNEGSSVDSYKLQYHNGFDWVDLFEYRTYGNGVSETYSFSNNVYAKKYRVIFGGSSTHNTRTIQLYGYDDIVKPLIPTMTSNTTPSGTVISHLYNGKQYPTQSGGPTYGDSSLIYYAFDGNDSTCTLYNTENVSDGWIGYQFDSPVKANKIITKIGNNLNTDSFEVHIQSYINNEWIDVADSFIVSGLPDGTYNVFDIDFYKTYQSDKFRIFTPTRKVPGTNLDIIDIQLYYFDPHLNSSGSAEAIRDWLNASFYNKEEIDELFAQSNQQGLIPYDLMITGDQPEQMIKLVGQTSGKTYNICLAALMGGYMINFSTEEQKTGMKWVDGKDVYQKTVVGDTMPTSGQTYITGVDELVCSFGAQLYSGGSPLRWYDFPFTGTGNGPRAEVDITTHNLNVIWGSGVAFTKYRWTFLYTKI